MGRQGDGKGSGGAGFRQGGPSAPRGAMGGDAKPARRASSQVIPDAVSKRMVRRIALATGIPSVLGMAVIVASYLLVSRQILSIPPVVTLLGSGAFFLLGLVGLSYGVVSASWEEAPGSPLGVEQVAKNVGRIRDSVRAMREGSGAGG